MFKRQARCGLVTQSSALVCDDQLMRRFLDRKKVIRKLPVSGITVPSSTVWRMCGRGKCRDYCTVSFRRAKVESALVLVVQFILAFFPTNVRLVFSVSA